MVSSSNTGPSKSGSFPFIAIGLLLGIGTGVLVFYLFSAHALRMLPKVRATSKSLPGAQPPNRRGPENAPVVIEVFSDFQCPPCKNVYEALNRIEDKYSSQVAIIYRQYPIGSLHSNAFGAACAAESAGIQGRFWDMHNQLFDHQQAWASSRDPRPLFIQYARSLQLDVPRFTEDLESSQTKQRVLADQKRGDSMGVPGTPVVLINGVQIDAGDLTHGLTNNVQKALSDGRGCTDGCEASGASAKR